MAHDRHLFMMIAVLHRLKETFTSFTFYGINGINCMVTLWAELGEAVDVIDNFLVTPRLMTRKVLWFYLL